MANQISAEEFDDELETILAELAAAGTALDAPPEAVWDRIQAEVASEQAPIIDAPVTDLAPVVDLAERRNRKRLVVWGGAIAAAAVVAVAFVSLGQDSNPSLVASAELAYDADNFDALGADAVANVALRDNDGTFQIDFDSADLPTTDEGDLELWLIEPDADGQVAAIVSLGLVDQADPGTFDVPEGYDPDTFYVVDISVEPRDGVPEHSGRSILRGALTEL